ncbi:uncharacterized protein LOC108488014 [Gossypium arboreum]|uniref:uncharacterized protein LOC108488014 n=1 Tax=Gossypium arboreum TaxID=29729 RepID=UPI000818F622|nr:uncharacterized protein LOC108488014 [Gossypium arboreum]
MACDTPKQAWERLKEEFLRSDKTRQQQLINLRKDFENLKMRVSETIKQYSDRIMATVNNIRLLRDDFSKSRIIEKVITILPEKFESKISSLEDSRDLSTISLSELINALYALEKKRANRLEEHPEGAFQAKTKESLDSSYKGKKPWLNKREKSNRDVGKKRRDWLVDSGYTHHMASDEGLFKDLDSSFVSKVKIGNGNLIEARGRGNVVISTHLGNKTISDVFFVPDINQNLLSVGQLIMKGYSLIFKNNSCIIEDSLGQELVSSHD